MRIISTIILFLLLIVLVAFACVNAKPITVNYYFGQITLALSVFLALAFVLGIFVGLLFAAWIFIKQKKYQLRLKQQLRHAEQKVMRWQDTAKG